jgi:hypothetical protein
MGQEDRVEIEWEEEERVIVDALFPKFRIQSRD